MQTIPVLTRFPKELTDHIIDASDYDTIATCGLVCRSWAKQSRRVLFEHLYLTPYDFQAFLRLLQNRTGTFIKPSQIRLLTLRRFERTAGELRATSVINRLSERGFSGFSNLRKITLSECYFGTIERFIDLVTSLSSVEEMELDNVLFSHTTNLKGIIRPQFPNLKTACFSEVHPRLVSWIIGAETTPVLKHISLKKVHHISQELSSVGRTLECLELDESVIVGKGTLLHHHSCCYHANVSHRL